MRPMKGHQTCRLPLLAALARTLPLLLAIQLAVVVSVATEAADWPLLVGVWGCWWSGQSARDRVQNSQEAMTSSPLKAPAIAERPVKLALVCTARTD